jgi:coenzyme F420-0:L-glutamate ligase/coenzyme F420-1:gamma-L-glutamate ligase
MTAITLFPISGLPEVHPGDNLAALIATQLQNRFDVKDGDILAISQKVVSKAEGQVRKLSNVTPSKRAQELSTQHEKDPRLVELILSESSELLRADSGRLICRTHHGLVCANAGVDLSNSGAPETAVLLPSDPDRSARRLRSELLQLTGAQLGIVITDSFGRPWRVGLTEVAIGSAGIRVTDDLRDSTDSDGRVLETTQIANADQIAAAADLARTKCSREPVVLVKGLRHLTTLLDGPGARSLQRELEMDLFP